MRVSVRQVTVMATALLVVTYALLVFGASVRVHGAGLACPDWPLCFGEVIPPIDFGVALEWGHRVLAGGVSIGFVALMAGVFAVRDRVHRALPRLAVVGLVVLGVQVILGGLTVWELLAEWTVASHLVAGNTFCLILLVHVLLLRDSRSTITRAPISWGLRVMAALLACIVGAQLVLGGVVSSSFAGLVCGTWPACNGDVWFPTFQGLIGLQVTHRLVAYILLVTALAMVVIARGSVRAGRAAIGVFLLVILQAGLGVANVLLLLPVEVTLAHTAGAAAIVLATTWLNYEVWRAPLRAANVQLHAVEAAR